MKTIKLLPIALVSLFTLSAVPGLQLGSLKAEEKTYLVDFYDNYKRESFTLSSGYGGRGNNLLYKSVKVTENSFLTPIEEPTRKNYEFKGWHLDAKTQNDENKWDFASMKVTSNTRLYARWGLSESSKIVEPTYTPPSTILEESAAEDYELSSIMNFVPSYGKVTVSKAAIDKLIASKDDILPLMEYKAKASSLFSATYDETSKTITIYCNGSIAETIIVEQDNYTSSDSNFESLAAGYEKNALDEESYHVMLAGSSSMEFWKSYKVDMDPIVTYNHGIGGTKIDDWKDKFNQRLVYPYKPKLVTYYVGVNDIKAGVSAENTINKLELFFNTTHSAMPNTQIQYVLINLVPCMKSMWNSVRQVNEYVKGFAETHSWLKAIDPVDQLLKDTGEPSNAYYMNDGMHMSLYGYSIWGKIVKESILEGLEELNS